MIAPSYTCFFFTAPATTELYTLSLHDALPICLRVAADDLPAHGLGRLDRLVEGVLRRIGHQDRLDVRVRRELLLRRSEEHTSELQSRRDLVCRLLLEKKK